MNDALHVQDDWYQNELSLKAFHRKLLKWGEKHFRIFPWRMATDPYQILIAEIMLHRTQATQVLPICESFIAKYPDLGSLSNASLEDLHSDLYSLGLRWRIDRLYEMCKLLMQDYQGQIPRKKKLLVLLPGVSEYIACAVRCFAWEQPESLADTNTIRIVGRIFGLEIKDSSRRNKTFKSLLKELVSKDCPKDYNYALLDLADKICTRKIDPDCLHCPVIEFCKYGNHLSPGSIL